MAENLPKFNVVEKWVHERMIHYNGQLWPAELYFQYLTNFEPQYSNNSFSQFSNIIIPISQPIFKQSADFAAESDVLLSRAKSRIDEKRADLGEAYP